MTKRVLVLWCLLVGIMVGSERALAVVSTESVTYFSVVAPGLVLVDSEFKLSVMEHDANGKPLAPQTTDTITLSARHRITGGLVPVTVSGGGNTFEASGNGIDDVMVTVSGVVNANVVFYATGYGVSESAATFRNETSVVTGRAFGSQMNGFLISVPDHANPNVEFPIYLTPVVDDPEDQELALGVGFSGTVELESKYGDISPTQLTMDVAAGESHMLMVSLNEVRRDNEIYVRLPSDIGKKFNVKFTNEDQTQLNDSVFSVHSQVFQDDASLSAQGVTIQSEWHSTVWPIEDSGNFNGGWNMLTRIPGIGPSGQALEFLTRLIPGSISRENLPGSGTFWSSQQVTINLGSGGWVLAQGSEPFPNGIAGSYWLRRTFFSNGNSSGTRTVSTFKYDSAEFDSVLVIVEPDGKKDEHPRPIIDYGVDKATWDAAIWSIPASSDTVYHIIATFTAHRAEDPKLTNEVTLFSTLTSSGRTPGPSVSGGVAIPDSLWNQNYIVDPARFSSVTGDSIPIGLDGSYWARFGLVGIVDLNVGTSRPINTTDVPFPARFHVQNAHGSPGDVVSVEVSLDLVEGTDASELQFDIAASEGADFQGAINHQSNFQITTSIQSPGVNRVLMFSPSGDTTGGDEAGHHVLMSLVYQLEDSLNFGDQINLGVYNSMLSNSTNESVEHKVDSAYIKVGVRGDLVGNDGVVDVTDLTALIRIILQKDQKPDTGSSKFFQADINSDGDINILDAVRTINIILERATAKPVAAGPTGPVRIDMGDVQVLPDGQATVPIRAQFDGGVAGLQLTLTYDSALIKLGDVLPAGRLEGMSVLQHESNGTLRLVVYSIDGRTFQASGLGTLLNLPIELTGRSSGDLAISQVVFAGPQAESVPVTLMNSSVRVSSTPNAFALLSNRPNPFNPSTQIAYEVPQQARMTLRVINILGQEVVRLVDQVQTPGRYVVTWNGRNSKGAGVSSGVYIYQLTSSTGYSDTRRMTLLK